MDILLSVISGGATGLLGTVLSGVTDYFKQRQANKMKLAMMAEEREMMRLEIQGAENVAKINAESAMDVAESEAFARTFSAERIKFLNTDNKWIQGMLASAEFIRAMVRPVLTTVLVIYAYIIYKDAVEQMNEEMVRYCTMTILYLTTTAVLWWFGTRNKATPPKK